jgi:S-adenosyl methyltransferase
VELLAGGRDDVLADSAAGDQVYEIFPAIVAVAPVSRAFLARAVRYLTAEAGVRQFLDAGTGRPAADNTHEVAQRAAPASRITSTHPVPSCPG